MAGRVLIVSTVEHADDALREHLGDADAVKVVVPIVRQGILDWLANDDTAYREAERIAKRTADEVPGEIVDAVPGEADVDLAIRDALATFPADEIVVAVHPDEDQGAVESMATDSAPTRSFDGIPVRYVVVRE